MFVRREAAANRVVAVEADHSVEVPKCSEHGLKGVLYGFLKRLWVERLTWKTPSNDVNVPSLSAKLR